MPISLENKMLHFYVIARSEFQKIVRGISMVAKEHDEGTSPNHNNKSKSPTSKKLNVNASISSSAQQINRGINELGYRLLNNLYNEKKNLMISPFSVSAALAMTLSGASGKTKEEMAMILKVSELTETKIHSGFSSLIKLADTSEKYLTFKIANSFWINKNLQFQNDFQNILKLNYNGIARQLTTPEAINSWVAENTENTIDHLVDEIDRDTVLLILNAVYFKGGWSSPFEEVFTNEQDFRVDDTIRVIVPFMEKSHDFKYQKMEKFTIVQLPYGDGRFSMEVLLPHEDISIKNLLQNFLLGEEKWDSPKQKTYGTLTLPKFSFASDINLNDVLKTLGMPLAFDEKMADFSRMTAKPPTVYIQKVKHITFIDVDEEGTEASSATSVELFREASRKEEFIMTVDRPFLFKIKDEESGALAFLGAISDPS